ncbi:MAG: DUF1194 domain-containing protein [Bauldia litoralis]
MKPRRWAILLGLVLVSFGAGEGPAASAATKVDLALVLAVDASRSIDAFEYTLQRKGYAQAFLHPSVVTAITSGEFQRIAVIYVEWSAAGQQAVLVGWTVIDGAESARRFSNALRAAPRRYFDATSVSGAIDFSVSLFPGAAVEATRRVIDISGDGPNNRGRPSEAARDDAVRSGITINGLAIVNDRPSRPPWPEEAVDKHYREKVVGGPGAFVMVVKGFEAFAVGIRQKLVREIAGQPPGRSLAVVPRRLMNPRR